MPKVDFTGINTPNADLSQSEMEFQTLTGVNFSNCNFLNARLSGTNFADANLANSRLTAVAALFSKFTAQTNLQKTCVGFALLLGAKYEDKILTDDILVRAGAKNVELAITSIEKLIVLLNTRNIKTQQLKFFKEQINHMHKSLYSYRHLKQNAMFINPEFAPLEPYSTAENIQLLREAFQIIDLHIKQKELEVDDVTSSLSSLQLGH